MKISRVELFEVPPRWLFLRLETDSGIVGWGEPIVEGKAATVKAAVEEMSDYLIGSDPSKIEDTFQALYRGGFYRGGPVLTSAISGIEQALWDIKGKDLGVPVYELMGGAVRDRVRVYSWIGGDSATDVANHARDRLAQGYTAVKMNPALDLNWLESRSTIEEIAQRIGSVREAVGAGLDIAVDFHGRVHRPWARSLIRELEPFGLYFIEEPVPPDHTEALEEIHRYTSIPIACGERVFTRWGFKDLLQKGCVDIIQPDLSHTGGIFEGRKIAAMAEAYDVAVAPHCPLGPITLAASLQLNFCTPNAIIQEQSLEIHYNVESDLFDYLINKEVFSYSEGWVERMRGPGLGIEIDEDLVRERSKESHRWRNPVLRTPDGAVAEW